VNMLLMILAMLLASAAVYYVGYALRVHERKKADKKQECTV